MEVVTDSATVYDPAAQGEDVHGRAAREAFLRGTHKAFPGFTLRTRAVLVNDDTVTVHSTVTGTLENEYYGAPSSGRSMEVSGLTKTTVTGGNIRENRLYNDRKDMLVQLGYPFPDVGILLATLVWGTHQCVAIRHDIRAL